MASVSRTDETTVRTSESPRFRPFTRLRDVFSFREILMNLVRKELKVKYTRSVLGAAWSMLNPVLYLAVFSFVFAFVLPSRLPSFPVYLLSGLVAWNMFSGSLTLAVRSVIDNTSLVKKVYFPKEILPLSAVGTSLVDFALQVVVLIVFMVIFGYAFLGVNTLMFPLALVALVTFTTAISLWVAGMNVRYRDTQHLLSLTLLAWFWLTPIVYPASLLQEKLSDVFGMNLFAVYLLNPMADIIFGFQRAFYKTVSPIGEDGVPVQVLVDMSDTQLALLLCGVILGSALVLLACWRTFFRMSGDFAEEL
ncbi:MAG: ABC transporter permease [Actinomycetota bacterium]